MEQSEQNLLIQNENLYRALVCAPLGIAFTAFAMNTVMNGGIFIFQMLFVLLALGFSLATLAYAAFYTNDLCHEESTHEIGNMNLFKTLFYTPVAAALILVTIDLITTSAHLLFQVSLILFTSYTLLKALAHAAYYTNDYHAEKFRFSH